MKYLNNTSECEEPTASWVKPNAVKTRIANEPIKKVPDAKTDDLFNIKRYDL